MAGSVSVASTAKYARPGELFGRIDLNNDLADDSKVSMPGLGSYLVGLTSTMTLLMTLR